MSFGLASGLHRVCIGLALDLVRTVLESSPNSLRGNRIWTGSHRCQNANTGRMSVVGRKASREGEVKGGLNERFPVAREWRSNHEVGCSLRDR